MLFSNIPQCLEHLSQYICLDILCILMFYAIGECYFMAHSFNRTQSVSKSCAGNHHLKPGFSETDTDFVYPTVSQKHNTRRNRIQNMHQRIFSHTRYDIPISSSCSCLPGVRRGSGLKGSPCLHSLRVLSLKTHLPLNGGCLPMDGSN